MTKDQLIKAMSDLAPDREVFIELATGELISIQGFAISIEPEEADDPEPPFGVIISAEL